MGIVEQTGGSDGKDTSVVANALLAQTSISEFDLPRQTPIHVPKTHIPEK